MKNKNINRKLFLQRKAISTTLLCLRLFIVIGCVSLIGARFFTAIGPDKMDRALFRAVQDGDKDQVYKLLLAGCNPDPLDEERNTPLYFTGFNTLYSDDYLEIMKLLLSFYANVDQQNYRGETTLHSSVRIENFEKLKVAFSTLLSYGANINLQDRDGNTMLNELVRLDTMGGVDILLLSYADIFGIEAIKSAIKQAYYYIYTDIVDFVLEKYRKQIESNSFIPPKERLFGEQHFAVFKKNYSFFENNNLKEKEGEIDAFGNNPLHLAVMVGDSRFVEYFLEKEKKLAVKKNKHGSFPLHFVSRAGNSLETRKAILRLFEKYDIDINQQDGTKSTLLHVLIRKRDFALLVYARQLFGKKIDYGVKDLNGETIKDLLLRIDKTKVSLLY